MLEENEYTIESGLQAIQEKAKFHRAEAERLERLVSALQEASVLLRVRSSTKSNRVGRPKNDEEKKALLDAIDKMPSEFHLTQLKAASSHIDLGSFRKLFRELKQTGEVVTVVEATGRRDGIYRKRETYDTAA